MFETSVVQAQAIAVKRRYSLLTVSVALHSVAILGALAVGIATVEFPRSAPDQFARYQAAMPVAVPPPLGNPNGGAPKPATPAPQKPVAAPPVPNQETAPSIVPDQTPQLSANVDAGPATGTESGPGTVPGPIGQPWGVEQSLGPLDGPPVVDAPAQPDPNAIYKPVGEVKSARVLRRVEPRYPDIMRRTRTGAVVRIRCIVDRNGRVRDPEIVMSSYPPFNDSVIAALRQWEFAPGTLRGQPVETWFELTVKFSLQ